MSKSINIKFPFQDSVKGFFVDMSEDDNSAIKNDLIHLLLTEKGERYYLPTFGSNLRKYIFEPNDGITHSEIRQDLNQTVKEYLPNLSIDNIDIGHKDDSEYMVSVRLDYTISEGVFETKDYVILEF
jgi:phage baseplate assembly protein W